MHRCARRRSCQRRGSRPSTTWRSGQRSQRPRLPSTRSSPLGSEPVGLTKWRNEARHEPKGGLRLLDLSILKVPKRLLQPNRALEPEIGERGGRWPSMAFRHTALQVGLKSTPPAHLQTGSQADVRPEIPPKTPLTCRKRLKTPCYRPSAG